MRIRMRNLFLTRDPGWKYSDPKCGINIPDPQHCKKIEKFLNEEMKKCGQV
jgi:hypothetical protein